VGFGTVLIKTSVLKGMKKPWFTTTSAVGEDIHFCHWLKGLGQKIVVDPSVRCRNHVEVSPGEVKVMLP